MQYLAVLVIVLRWCVRRVIVSVHELCNRVHGTGWCGTCGVACTLPLPQDMVACMRVKLLPPTEFLCLAALRRVVQGDDRIDDEEPAIVVGASSVGAGDDGGVTAGTTRECTQRHAHRGSYK